MDPQQPHFAPPFGGNAFMTLRQPTAPRGSDSDSSMQDDNGNARAPDAGYQTTTDHTSANVDFAFLHPQIFPPAPLPVDRQGHQNYPNHGYPEVKDDASSAIPALPNVTQPWTAVATNPDVPPAVNVFREPTKGKQRQLEPMPPSEQAKESFTHLLTTIVDDDGDAGDDAADEFSDDEDEEMGGENPAPFDMQELERELAAFARNDPANPAARVFLFLQQMARAQNGGTANGPIDPAPRAQSGQSQTPNQHGASSPQGAPKPLDVSRQHGRLETVHRTPEKLRLEKQVRIYSRKIMNRPNRDSPFLPPPTPLEMEAFEKHGGPGPTLKAFHVNVTGRNRKGAWNRRCAYIFAHDFVKISDAESHDVDVVAEAFLSHITALCRQYRMLSAANGDGDEDIIVDGIRLQNTQKNRKRGLAKRRHNIMVKPALKKLGGLIDLLGVQGHSADETDREHKTNDGRVRYLIKRLEWRSDEATQYLRALDVVHLSTRWKRDGRPRTGQFPRIRVAVKNNVDRDTLPVPGLPRNFYDPSWLAAQSEEDRIVLRIQDFDADLSIPDSIRRIIRRYAHATGPGSPPLPE